MTPAKFRLHLRKIATPQRDWAKANDISESYLSDVLIGHRNPGEKILRAAGFEKVVSYRKKVKP